MSPDTMPHLSAPVAMLRRRTTQLALGIIRACHRLPVTPECRIIAYQLIRSATSVAANYRAARRARSRREIIAKVGLVVEESDETLFWLELLVELRAGASRELESLAREANELTSIFVVTRHRARSGLRRH
jgi:four helix bundle protein